MIDEARKLPPSMVAVTIAFISLFIVLASGTILAVVADDTVEGPPLEEFPFNSGAEIVDTMATCTDAACDGHGILLMGRETDAAELTEDLSQLWRRRGWVPVRCLDRGEVCFGEGELRISLRNWDQVDPMLAPTFVEGVADRSLDPGRLLYAHFYRCGLIHACN
jgi:hypothetical protein